MCKYTLSVATQKGTFFIIYSLLMLLIHGLYIKIKALGYIKDMKNHIP